MSNYTEKELTKWNTYLLLLVEVAIKVDGHYDGLSSAKTHPCPHCARVIPPGVPTQILKSEWVMCPACVNAKHSVTALERWLFSADDRKKPTTQEAKELVKKAKESVTKKPVRAPPAVKISRLENLMETMRLRAATQTGAEQIATERLLEATARALVRMKGAT